MTDDKEYLIRRNEIAVAVLNDTKLERIMENCRKVYDFLRDSHILNQNTQERHKKDLEMYFCFGSLYCQSVMSNERRKINPQELMGGVPYLKYCYNDKDL